MIAFVDCFSGASGDMLLGALLDAGFALEDLEADLGRLPIRGYELRLFPAQQHGISGRRFEVLVQDQERPARNLSLVQEILTHSDLPKPVIANSLRIFTRLAEAEARVHGVGIDEVHFHEIGAVDTLVDIVGFCSGLHRLNIETLYASPLPLGSGTIHTEHGILPVPVPATLALIADVGAPTIPTEARTELVTPTGAAILTTLARFERPAMRVHRVGYGFGVKVLPWPNMLRIWLGEPLSETEHRHHSGVGHVAHHEHPHGASHAHEHGED